MAGSYLRSSRVLVGLAIAVATAAATTATVVYERCCTVTRWARAQTERLVLAVINHMPRLQHDWSRPDVAVRVKKDGRLAAYKVAKRRPLVSPRWRLCPSV